MSEKELKKPVRHFVITAGPTREHLDPVRFLSNPSTGKMGFELARAAVRRGHRVTLIAGPVSLKTPQGVTRIDVVSAREMLRAVEQSIEPQTIFISTAAVADWRPEVCAAQKLKKSQMTGVLKLVRNPDILATVQARVKVGFAAETGPVAAEAQRKMRTKGLALIVANDVTQKGVGFGTATNKVDLFYADGRQESLPLMTKRSLGNQLIQICENLCS